MDTWVATHTFLDKQHKSMDTEVAVVFGFYLLTSTSGSSSIIYFLRPSLPPSYTVPSAPPIPCWPKTQSNLIYDDTVAIPLPKLYSSVPLGAQERHSIWKMRGGVPLTGTPLTVRNIELMPPLIHVHAALNSKCRR